MTGASGLVIEESKEQLEGMLKKEKNLKTQQRIQVLYLMQSEKMPINKIGVSIEPQSIDGWSNIEVAG